MSAYRYNVKNHLKGQNDEYNTTAAAKISIRSDAFAYYWVIAMYTLSVYEFVSFVRYGAYNATSSLIASVVLGIIGWCFSSKAGAQEQKNYTIEFGVNGTLGNGFSMRYKGHPVKVSYTLDGQGRFVGGKNLKDSIFFADGTKISGHQKM